MPELERFAERFALRLMAAVNADCVDLYRVSGGVIRGLVDLTRDGVDTSRSGMILDTAKYPSLERTLIDLTPLVIDDLTDRRLAPEEVERYHTWGYASSLTMPLVSGGTLVGLVAALRRRRAPMGPRGRVPHRRHAAGRRSLRQRRAAR